MISRVSNRFLNRFRDRISAFGDISEDNKKRPDVKLKCIAICRAARVMNRGAY